ncbi:MAG: RluA family pseudouridine synthase [Mycoplasmataceae bacterium]|jgi:23S rRNA pseudouridine1911/1915/1917 synthase|nr:RluA family pseudouridine synthase [Mycoplasmataceae bacterium]
MQKIVVPKSFNEGRLDLFLVKELSKSRNYISKLFKLHLIKVNDEPVKKPGHLLQPNDKISVGDLSTPDKNSRKPIKHEVQVIFEDQDIIVINKPKNIIAHPTSFNEKDTIVNIFSNKIKVEEFVDQSRPGIVHRLDRNTTGLMVIARNKKAYDSLTEQINKKILIRKYLVLVHGTFKDEALIIKAPIKRSRQNLLKMVVSDEPSAKLAVTEIKLIANYKDSALIECKLLTGRTHQIRAHLAYIHHYVFNDEMYGHADGYANYEQFLHAHYLSFIHPTTHKQLEFHSEPDATFLRLQSKLKRGNNV